MVSILSALCLIFAIIFAYARHCQRRACRNIEYTLLLSECECHVLRSAMKTLDPEQLRKIQEIPWLVFSVREIDWNDLDFLHDRRSVRSKILGEVKHVWIDGHGPRSGGELEGEEAVEDAHAWGDRYLPIAICFATVEAAAAVILGFYCLVQIILGL